MSDIIVRPESDEPNELALRTADEVNTMLKRLADAIDIGRLKQAELLVHMYEGKRYEDLEYGTFEDYVESELAMSRRTAFYRMSVYNKLVVKLQVPVKTIEEMGWSKSALIAPKMDNISAKHWVDLANTNSYRGLKRHMQVLDAPRSKEEGGEERLPLHQIVIGFTDDQLENFEAALDNAAKATKGRARGMLIDYICLQFNSDAIFTDGSTSKASQLEWYIKRLENTYGVKLEVRNDTSRDSIPDATISSEN